MDESGPYEASDSSKLVDEVFGGKVSVEVALTKLRTRLLDLTLRNKLLNYRPPKGRAFQFTGGFDFDLLFERLKEGEAVSLMYVPDPPAGRYENGKKPDVRAFAKELGITTSFDLARSIEAARRQRGQMLQVLLYPADLERMARKVAGEAHTVIEETGSNMLYLMFGYLEYFDSDDSEKPVLAPLLSMPISLTKGSLDGESRTYLYEVAHSGEDIVENFTLREKLRQQFRLELPQLEEDDSPNDYLDKIAQAVSKRRNWTIRRRLTLGFLSFGKLAIWADLDPEKSESLLSSALLRNIFEGGRIDPGSDGFHAEDYDIDRHVDADLPLIYDADSSQHSALIDVKAGKSLVINGPPGTGKSQTITNIIASAIAAGKKVLFVSEKLAALEVVKQRLQAVGLGDFCLELHSHKTQKKQLLASIEERMSGRYSAPQGYAKHVDVLRKRRDALNTYAALLGSRIGNNLDYTVHKVFWLTEQARQALGSDVDAVTGLSIAGAKDWTAEDVERCRRAVRAVAAALSELGCLPADSPWLGFLPDLIIQGDELPVLEVARVAMGHAEELTRVAAQLDEVMPGVAWTQDNLRQAAKAAATLAAVPQDLDSQLLAQVFPRGLESLTTSRQEIQRLGAELAELRLLRDRAEIGLFEFDTLDESTLSTFAQGAKELLSPAALRFTLGAVQEQAASLRNSIGQLAAVLGDRDASIPGDPANVGRVVEEASRSSAFAGLLGQPVGRIIESANAVEVTAASVKSALDHVSAVMKAANLPFAGRTDEVEDLLDGRSMAELLPDAASGSEELASLRSLDATGLGNWTAERFTVKAREITELVATAESAAEALAEFLKRVGIPWHADKDSLVDLETLLALVESAPQDLLTHRAPSFARPDFSEVATRAEEEHKSVLDRAGKIAAAFEVDVLPDDEALRVHVQALRRDDSVFNVFRSDWRRAKAAFKGCSRQRKGLSTSEMAERFAAVRAWRTAEREFIEHEEFKAVLGSLFAGLKTDFGRIRRLHGWFAVQGPKLLESSFAGHVVLHAMPEQHIALLATNGTRLRAWAACIERVFQFVHSVPGLDPALTQTKRLKDAAGLLSHYAQNLTAGAGLLRATVRPTATVSRAIELLSLRQRLHQHEPLLRSLLVAPEKLAAAGEALGLPSSVLSYQDLRTALALVEGRSAMAMAIGRTIAVSIGPAESVESARTFLEALKSVGDGAAAVAASRGRPARGPALALVEWGAQQARSMLDIARFMEAAARPAACVGDAVASAEAALEHRRRLSKLAEDSKLRSLLGRRLVGEQTDEAALALCLSWAEHLQPVSQLLPREATRRLFSEDAANVASAAGSLLGQASAALSAYKAAMEQLARKGRLDWTVWGGTPKPADALARLQRALAGPRALIPWSKFLAAKADLEEMGAVEIVSCVERGTLRSELLTEAFDYMFHRALSKGILSTHRELARFSGDSHERLRKDYADLDKQLIKLNGAMYAAKVDAAKRPLDGISAGRAGDLTEMALLSKETKKQKRHIPIRQLLKRAGRSLLELKPCFMMGPLSVAQYLEQGYLSFDLVVMDEASQLRPEDALGAIARGKQLVVVGDPKQLPPTNFFDQLMSDEDEDPDDAPAVVDGAESILGICEHLYRPVRTLRWHYRSRHESLIAFSNAQFYGGRLVVFPSPYKRNRRLGVNYCHVGDGLYQYRRNVPEAQRIVKEVIEHMLTIGDESLGVVTLNQTQRELIQDLFDQKSRDVPAVANYLARHKDAGWPFFIKNLENVQGDERDVIFVSTTFGKPQDGSPVRQNFGPINRPDGWRRLNVLFTRARRRLDLFTSMLPQDIQVDGDKVSLGRRALRDYLEFARTGTLPGPIPQASGREPDSDFEVAVAEALRLRGYQCEPQVGVAGYFIDLGVRHPERKSEFLVGVECDGATYHSSLSARDRDRIRQEILESLGWRGRIIRVWSTDWFSDPKGQTDRLVRHLERRLVEDREQPPPYADVDLVEAPKLADPPGLSTATANLAAGSVTVPQESMFQDLFAEVGDRVTYEMLGPAPERHTVQLVDSQSNLRLGLLNEDTPLAQTLLGLCEGDETVLKVPGKPGMTLRVLRIVREVASAGPAAVEQVDVRSIESASR